MKRIELVEINFKESEVDLIHRVSFETAENISIQSEYSKQDV
jgi:hypothetical protein